MTRSCLLGLSFVALVGDLGCSHFKSKRNGADDSSPLLGTELPSRDIYAKKINPHPDETQTASMDEPSTLDQPPAGGLVPATSGPPGDVSPTGPIVKLQPPVMVDPARIGAMPTSAGVPNGARLIASSGKVDQAPTPSIKTTTRVVGEARQALDAMSNYQLALRRQERVNGNLLPQEDLVMSIRRSPKAARLTWMDGPHQGREVLYRSDEPGGMMHVNMADSKLPVPRLTLAPDSPLVMKNSRHPITEAGLDPIVASMEQADQAGGLSDLGLQTPPPLDHPHQGVLQKTPSGDIWRAYFDPETHLPALVECRAANGDLVESYLFQKIQPNLAELASADAFDATARWGPPRGLFGRASARATNNESATTTR